MDGPEVYRRAVAVMTQVTHEAVAAAGLELADIDLFVYHQANARILRAVGQRLGLDPDRVVDYVARYANTSAASLPIALATAAAEGRLRPGHRVLLAAFGAGLVWGGVVVEWG
jgi:3-oxoacyl-[acyl-carrier-protein] synthase III